MHVYPPRTAPLVRIALALAALLAAAAMAGGADWYASPNGMAKAKGTRESPLEIEAALGNSQVKPGDTVYLMGGKYQRRPAEKFVIRLAGAEGKPIQVRPAPGERAIIDGGISFQNPSAHVWLRDVEILVSEPQPAKPVGPGSFPKDFTRPWGGLSFDGGNACKAINLIIHDCRQGISAWSSARDTEIYGCIIYDNGWPATDRGHGHAIYTQNKDGIATIRDCIMTGGHGYTMHAYGSSRAYVDNFLIEGNIAYNGGSFLIGGGRPSHNIRARDNYLYGISLQLGYSAPFNEDCEVRDNVIVNGGLIINKYKKVVKEGNVILPKGAPRAGGSRTILRSNNYDPRRANVVVFNWDKKPQIDIDPAALLKKGDDYRLLNPRDFFGRPVLTGKYEGEPIRVPVTGEFAAFVLVKATK
jgi:hypothetical protein